MFKLNLKIALRNLFKNKGYAAINIGGLAIGLTAFVLLLLFVNHEANYDKWSPELKNVYQVREYHDFFTPDNKQYWQQINESRIAGVLKEKVPQFKYVTKASRGWGDGYSIKIDRNAPVIVKDIVDADSLFFKVFPYQFINGDGSTAMNEPNTIVLKQSVAIQLFGTDKVVGKQLKLVRWRSDEGNLMTITGVVKNPSASESLAFTAVIHTGEREKDPDQISSSNYTGIYAKTEKQIDTNVLNKTLLNVYTDYKKALLKARGETFNDFYKAKSRKPGLKVLPLSEVYSNPSFSENWLDKIKPIIALSIFLLIISVINFVNLATAQSVQRAKEVGVKKVLGAYKKQLVLQFLIESAIQTLSALFITIILVELLLPSFSSHFDVQLSFWHSNHLLPIIAQLFGLFVFITLLAGFYPAIILAKYNPVKVLKGNYESSFKGMALRNGLVVLQFIIAVTFIIGIGVMYKQNSYMANKDLGFDRDKLINISTNYDTDDPFVESVKRIAGVKYVATTTQVMGNTFNTPRELTFNNQKFDINAVTVTMDALPALGVKVISGRIFAKEYAQDTINSVVINQAAANLLGKNLVGKTFTSGSNKDVFQIVGVIKNYNNESFEKAVLPTIYKVTHLGGSSNTNNLLVRFDNDHYQSAIKTIEAEWKKVYPDFPMMYTSVEDSFQKELKPSLRLMQIVVLFSVISVILSLLGLFALSTFMAKRRTKEIAIRKILGASNLELINMLNRSFLILVIIANLISWPIAFILTRKWLEGFAYRIEMPFWPFAIATLTSVIIAILTVSLQARKAAVNNPVDALKYE
ncbi:ABC transporter permease [Pedobacter boryungensis]|uniref:ABC transporter permease n=1 Tax=Pedobacter boryungensis TaxID=869962 RepID=A0ABX2D8T6_9SPHI|nr:ABC transporter permease [Pedobacter boryungensis]NQX30390.1 ABC transporter permease [Pedobacter boryungensis]